MILARHILREHLLPFVLSVLVITGLFLVDFLLHVLDSILVKGLPVLVVLELFILNTAWILALSVPMSVLVATLMAFGRMSADREIQAMRAVGTPSWKILAPPLLCAGLIAAGLAWFNDRVLPAANYRASSLREDIARMRPAALLEARTVVTDFEGFRIWMDSLDHVTGRLRGATLVRLDPGSPPQVVRAQHGNLVHDSTTMTWRFTLLDGESMALDRDDHSTILRIRFNRLEVQVPDVDASLRRQEKGWRNDREMPVSAMRTEVLAARERRIDLIDDGRLRILSDVDYLRELIALDSASGVDPIGADLPPVGASAALRLRDLADARLAELNRLHERLQAEKREEARFLVEIHKKFSIPAACIVFVLVGAPLGVMARAGGLGTGVAYSLAFFVLHWASLIWGESQADQLRIPAWLAMWAPNILLLLLGLVMVRGMGRHTALGGLLQGKWPWRRPGRSA